MKLRDRTKRVLSKVKQEDDHKSAFTTMDSSTATSNDASTFDLTIKQEEIKEYKSLSKQDGNLDEKEYHFQCNFCKMKMANLISVLDHRTSIHGIKQRSITMIKNIDVEPDVHEPNFYCKSCERGYRNTKSYRQHLRQAHYMILKPMHKRKAPKNDIAPDPNDPSLYCRACNHTYKSKSIYKTHCQYTHGLNPANANRTQTSSTLTDSYCQACNKRLSSMQCYRQHLFAIHKVDARPIKQKQNDIMPNVNDPNFYCRSCEKKLTNKLAFKQHLKRVHFIPKSAPKKSSSKPDVDDPNNYCRTCQKKYPSKGIYRAHLRLTHQMTLTPLRGNINREHLPDPYNPDYYCSVCKKSHASLGRYRLHCKTTHFMELNHVAIVNSSATINVNHPKLNCAQCEYSFSSKIAFKRHLARIHSIY